MKYIILYLKSGYLYLGRTIRQIHNQFVGRVDVRKSVANRN